MSTLESIIEGLAKNQEAVRRIEEALTEHPDEWTLRTSLRSLRKVEQELGAQFAEAASQADLAVLRYRIFSEDPDRLTLTSFTEALGGFQKLFTLVYDALRTGRKGHGRPSPDAIKATALRPGYLFTGSVGIVLTLPKHLYLLGEVDLDEAMKTSLEMSQCTSSDQVKAYAERLGVAPIRALYNWAKSQAGCNIGADIAWRESDPVSVSLVAQPPEWVALQQAIDETSDEVDDIITVSGRLDGARTTKHAFWLELEPGNEISGTLDDEVLDKGEVVVNKHYRATIRRTTSVNYATEEDQIRYHLMSLDPV